MKKIIWLFFLLGGLVLIKDTVLISHRLYVSSIYFDKKEEYEIVFYCPSALSVGKSESATDASNTIIKESGSSIEEVFNKIEMSTGFEMNYRHVVSVIFSDAFLEMEQLSAFVKFIVESEYIDFNFYVFTTSETGEDLFSFENPDDTSTYYSILNVTSDNKYLFNYISPLEFVRFLRLYHKKNFLLKIPKVIIQDIYQIGDKKVKNITLDGISVVKNKQNDWYNLKELEGLLFLNSFQKAKFYLEKIPIVINEVDISLKGKANLDLNITIDYKALFDIVKQEEVKEYCEMVIKEALVKLYSSGYDYLRINDYNLKHMTNYEFADLKLKLNLHHN